MLVPPTFLRLLALGHLGEQQDTSPQFMIQCNYLNEGCEGAWSDLDAIFAEHGHIPTEECAPYQGATRGDTCAHYAACEPYATVNGSYFVSGYHGKPTVAQI